VLHTIHKLEPRKEPAPLEELDPLSRGSLMHEVKFAFYSELRDRGKLPITPENLPEARALLDTVLERVADAYREALAPAIDRVFRNGIDGIRADLRESLRRASEEETWVPAHFELSFGLAERRDRDPVSRDEDVPLGCGIRLRGSIDLVEKNRDGSLRATDYKSGKARATEGTVIGGGETLQPVLYALVLEKLFPGQKIESGRLYYCTVAADFRAVSIPLDDAAREGALLLARTIAGALEQGFFPAAPAPRACEYCDYARLCGPYEELRATKIKRRDALRPLELLRGRA
jgi:CRISPR/Cas system-associated exonuclease Cas4 (RecB family)